MEKLCYYSSPIGKILISTKGNALSGIWLEKQEFRPLKGTDHIFDRSGYQNTVISWLDGYFSGKAPGPYELNFYFEGTDFQKTVWNELLDIPYGTTVSYGELAERSARLIGKSRMSAQAIGQAVSRNRISIIVPCHRVIGKDGSLTGYAGGTDIKRWLLTHEGSIRNGI